MVRTGFSETHDVTEMNHMDKENRTEVNQPISAHDSITTMPKRDWGIGLCGCFFSCKTCCYAWCCQPFFLLDLYQDANESCFSYYTSGLASLRTKIRTDRGIEGSIWKDCCAVFWCYFCASIQMAHEVENTDPVVHYQKAPK